MAAGLSLAVIGTTSQFGVFTVYGAVLLGPMVYVFARLHGHAPQARTTSDLVGAVLGERLGVFAGLIQLVAYLLDFRSFRGLGERSCWSAVTAVVYVSGEVVGVSA